VPRFRLTSRPAGGLLLEPIAIKLSLCMIVRDNETTIGPALESIRPWVDEIIVVDTGSRDKTPDICRPHGAEMHSFPWCDDFSAARNESLKYARGEWIFWMDSDDTISPECGQKLRILADGPHQDDILGYIMQVHCPGPGEEGQLDVTAVDHVKLIRNRPDLRFEGRIHEQLLPAIRRVGGDVEWTDIYVRHSGSDHSPEGWQRKLDRDLRILHQELEDKPRHPFVLFNLGMTYADAKRNEEAVGFLERCLAVSTPDESHLRKAFSLLVNSLSQAERHDEAWQHCQKGLRLYPDDKELLFRSAILHHHFGRLQEAERTYLRVLNDHETRHFISIDQGLAGYKARHNLAIVYEEMDRFDQAEHQWRRVTEEVPAYRLGWRGLGNVLFRQGRFADVQFLCDHLEGTSGLVDREAHILRGRLAAARGDLPDAVRQLRFADEADAEDLEPLQTLCRILFEQGEPAAAESALQELTQRAPSDAAALHNLGTIRQRLQRHAAAATAFQSSLQIRPRSAPTYLQLGYALYESGARDAAAIAWKAVLNIDPENSEARLALTSA
jgi:tetratricopeptide (TPR) repeat protein